VSMMFFILYNMKGNTQTIQSVMSFWNIDTMENQCHMRVMKTMYKDANFFAS